MSWVTLEQVVISPNKHSAGVELCKGSSESVDLAIFSCRIRFGIRSDGKSS